MGNTSDRLIRVPNADVWVDKTSVVAVARTADSVINSGGEKPGQTATKVTVINFNIRLIDGKAVNIQSPDRTAIKNFLHAIGVTLEG